jgi:hypothetical protein
MVIGSLLCRWVTAAQHAEGPLGILSPGVVGLRHHLRRMQLQHQPAASAGDRLPTEALVVQAPGEEVH